MAGEIYATHSEGSSLYATVRRQSDGYVWNTNTTSFETWNDLNLSDYAISLTDQDGNYYEGDFPAVASGAYIVMIFVQVGGSPADGDWVKATGWMDWDGTAEHTLADISGDIATIDSVVDLIYEETHRVDNVFPEEEDPETQPRIINL